MIQERDAFDNTCLISQVKQAQLACGALHMPLVLVGWIPLVMTLDGRCKHREIRYKIMCFRNLAGSCLTRQMCNINCSLTKCTVYKPQCYFQDYFKESMYLAKDESLLQDDFVGSYKNASPINGFSQITSPHTSLLGVYATALSATSAATVQLVF